MTTPVITMGVERYLQFMQKAIGHLSGADMTRGIYLKSCIAAARSP
jgi:hypothetical protein